MPAASSTGRTSRRRSSRSCSVQRASWPMRREGTTSKEGRGGVASGAHARPAIVDAFKRKEIYASTGPRIAVPLFSPTDEFADLTGVLRGPDAGVPGRAHVPALRRANPRRVGPLLRRRGRCSEEVDVEGVRRVQVRVASEKAGVRGTLLSCGGRREPQDQGRSGDEVRNEHDRRGRAMVVRWLWWDASAGHGVYQMGLVQARSWMLVGRLSSGSTPSFAAS